MFTKPLYDSVDQECDVLRRERDGFERALSALISQAGVRALTSSRVAINVVLTCAADNPTSAIESSRELSESSR